MAYKKYIKRRICWFFHGDLVSIEHVSKAQGILTLWNWTADRQMSVSAIEFKKRRKKAYTSKELADLIGYNAKVITKLHRNGVIPPPIGRNPGGERIGSKPSFYSEEMIFQIRDILAGVHKGPPRKDGAITNNKIPSESALRAKMYHDQVFYIKDKDGNFIPTFAETI